MAAINDLTGRSNAYLMGKVEEAYFARYAKNLPKVTFASPKEDPNVEGRIHFKVKKGSKIIGDATYKPKRRSVWVAWR
jgi:hypothetical protein